MRRLVLLGIAAVLVVAFTVLWVVPVVAGPSIDCGPLDEATCERIVADIIARHDHPPAEAGDFYAQRPAFMPVTSVQLGGNGSYSISWLYFWGFVVIND